MCVCIRKPSNGKSGEGGKHRSCDVNIMTGKLTQRNYLDNTELSNGRESSSCALENENE